MAYPFGAVPPCGDKGLHDSSIFSHSYDCGVQWDKQDTIGHDECAVHFDSFNCYGLSFELAARELARRPEAQDDPSLQDAICRRYGIFLDNLTDDEISELENQICMCVKKGE